MAVYLNDAPSTSVVNKRERVVEELLSNAPRFASGSTARIVHAVLLILAQALCVFVIGFRLAESILPAPQETIWDGSAPAFGLALLIAALSLVAVLWLGLVRWGRVQWRDLGWTLEHLPMQLLHGAIGLSVAVLVLFGLLRFSGVTASDFFQMLVGYTLPQRALFALIGVQAALVEESLFRGYLQPTFNARLGTVAGVVVTALVFAIYHLNFSPLGLAGKFFLGLIYGILREQSQALVSPAFAHFGVWFVIGML